MAPTRLLGCFRTPEDAQAAKAHYARVRDTAPDADPWRRQAQKAPGPVGPDLEIETLPGEFPDGTIVDVVSNHREGFGQDRRELDSVHAVAATAKRRVKELNRARDGFPHFATVDPVIVGRLHSDAREDQPDTRKTEAARTLFETHGSPGSPGCSTILEETLEQLESLGNAKVRAQNKKKGAGGNQFGVRLGDIRKLAEKIKTNDELAAALWNTWNIDARLLAILLINPEKLSRDEMDRMVRTVDFVQVADWFSSYVVKNHPEKEHLRRSWMEDDATWAARAGWSLTSERIAKNPDGLDLPALLDRIKSEMRNAAPEVQWTMNSCLAGIGIHFPKHRKRAIAIGEKLGIYSRPRKDWAGR
ncbi:MAG TPA: DNA alkylation repair protein [Thermoanaerobaculia bacterium]